MKICYPKQSRWLTTRRRTLSSLWVCQSATGWWGKAWKECRTGILRINPPRKMRGINIVSDVLLHNSWHTLISVGSRASCKQAVDHRKIWIRILSAVTVNKNSSSRQRSWTSWPSGSPTITTTWKPCYNPSDLHEQVYRLRAVSLGWVKNGFKLLLFFSNRAICRGYHIMNQLIKWPCYVNEGIMVYLWLNTSGVHRWAPMDRITILSRVKIEKSR